MDVDRQDSRANGAGGRYRRAPGLVTYWDGAQLVAHVWPPGRRVPLTADAVAVLDILTAWTSPSELRDRVAPGADVSHSVELLTALHNFELVEREGDAVDRASWSEWSPEAAFFHFATKNGQFPEELEAHDAVLVAKAVHTPPPPPTKRVEGVSRVSTGYVPLPEMSLHAALATRRTWRRYAAAPVPFPDLAGVLRATFGVRRRGYVQGQGEIVVKTSPSGGARHPIEAYLLAWNVDGLKAGVYHYDCAVDELVDLGRDLSASDIPALLAHQTYFAAAGAAVVMCPVFARTMWRYGHSRAYRTVLIDAGHLGQTFCLAATAAGLAPFSTMAFSEAGLESLLQLDGVQECPIFVVGVGVPDLGSADNPGRWTDPARPAE